MIDPKSNVAEQLAGALKHHQKNMIETNKARKNVEVLREMVTQLETLSAESGTPN